MLYSIPQIQSLKWGEIKIQHDDGSIRTYNDCKIIPSGSCYWDWRLTNTHHVPGVQIADVQDLPDDIEIIILSTGMHQVLRVQENTINYLQKMGKQVYIAQTEKAVELYIRYTKAGKRVAALIHTTC